MSRGQQARSCILKNFLALGFLFALILSLLWPSPGKIVAKPEFAGFRVVQTINVIIIFFLSGVTLKSDDIKKAVSKDGRVAFGYGVVSVLGITACLGFVAVEIPFAVKEFSYGLAVFCVVPTTLSTGITQVAQAGGNDALALLLTVTTNLLGVATTPFLVKAVLKAGDDIDAVDLLVKLIVSVLIPLVVGKMFREMVPGVKEWVANWREQIGITNSVMLILVVWQTLSRAQEDITSVPFEQILTVIAAGVILHLIFLAINWPVCNYILHLSRPEMKAVVMMASQKTLPVSVTVIAYLGSLGTVGLMTIPCIITHMAQLFLDAYLAAKWGDEVSEEASASINL